MKYISLIVFTAALVWTWDVVHHHNGIDFETHSGIQEKLATLINDTIKARRPTASEIVIEKIWTEVISSNKVRAFFTYSFKDNSEASGGIVTSQIKGEGLLERQPNDGSGNDRWSLTKVHTTSDAIQFDEATIVTGNSTETSLEAGTDETTKTVSEPTTTEEHK